MTTGAGSLLDAAAQADRAAPPFSFFSEVEEAEKRLAESGEFTGERLFRDRPGIYAAAVRMIAEGQSISATSRALSISRNTVCAVRDREGVSVEQEKKELLRDLRRASRLGVEKVLELLPETKSAKDAAIVTAVMVDKAQLIGGDATSRVERVDVRPDQVKAYLDALPVVDAEVLEVISTGVPGETDGQKAAGLVAALPAPLSDSLSEALTPSVSVEGSEGTNARTMEAGPVLEAGTRSADGGGGGAAFDHCVPGVIDSDSQNFGQRDLCSGGDGSDTHPAVLGEAGRPVLATERGAADGGPPAASDLCKATTKKKQGGGPKRSSAKPSAVSTKAPITKKKKGGSAS
jgi:hypothetical protein